MLENKTDPESRPSAFEKRIAMGLEYDGTAPTTQEIDLDDLMVDDLEDIVEIESEE